jgi:hypothetical protein
MLGFLTNHVSLGCWGHWTPLIELIQAVPSVIDPNFIDPLKITLDIMLEGRSTRWTFLTNQNSGMTGEYDWMKFDQSRMLTFPAKIGLGETDHAHLKP